MTRFYSYCLSKYSVIIIVDVKDTKNFIIII